MAPPPEPENELQALLKFLYMAPVGIIQTTIVGDITLINPMAANLLMPLQPNGTLVNLFAALEHSVPDLGMMVLDHPAASGKVCTAYRFSPFHRARRHAEQKSYEITVMKIDPLTLMTVLTDVTDAVNREEQIRLGTAWYNALLADRFNHGAVGLDEDGVVMNWNAAMHALTGYTETQMVGRSCAALFGKAGGMAERLPDVLYEAGESGWTMQNDWCITAAGTSFWASYLISAAQWDIHLPARAGSDVLRQSTYVLQMRDITKYYDASSKMMHATKIDFLTGILNRRAFFDAAETELKRWWRSPRPMCLLAIDADHFKVVNDRFGHDVGDIVLKALAQGIKENVRETDVTARIGGEEFVVLLPYTALDDARDLAERIRKAAEELGIVSGDVSLHMTISIGVAQMTPECQDIGGLMKRADRSLYVAKNTGRNRVVTD